MPLTLRLASPRGVADIAGFRSAERDELAAVYLELHRGVDRLFPGMERPDIGAWRQAFAGAGRDLARLHRRLFSLTRSAGRMKSLAAPQSALGR
jgi:hypothetical protein